MPKSAILNLDREGLLEQTSFKKLSLFFDEIYVNHENFELAKSEVKMFSTLEKETKHNLLSELEWLQANNILKTYHISRSEIRKDKISGILTEDIEELGQEVLDNLHPVDSAQDGNDDTSYVKLQFGVLRATNDLIFKMEDLWLRIAADLLGRENPTMHFIPLVNSFNSYHKHKSTDFASHFVLGKLPVPDDTTSWEQIMDFRSDEDVKRKYYALLNWVNEMGNKELPLSQLADQYHQLYSEYTRQYQLHKLSSQLTTIELLLLGGVEFISSLVQHDLLKAFKGLVHFKKERVTLLQSEKDIEGRELAYIFKANEQFK